MIGKGGRPSAFGVTYKQSLLNSRSQKLTPICSSKSFLVSAPTFMSLIHFELIFLQITFK